MPDRPGSSPGPPHPRTERVILGKPNSTSVPHSLVSKAGTTVLRAEAVVRYSCLGKDPCCAQQILILNRHLVNTKDFLKVDFCKSMQLSLLIYLLSWLLCVFLKNLLIVAA